MNAVIGNSAGLLSAIYTPFNFKQWIGQRRIRVLNTRDLRTHHLLLFILHHHPLLLYFSSTTSFLFLPLDLPFEPARRASPRPFVSILHCYELNAGLSVVLDQRVFSNRVKSLDYRRFRTHLTFRQFFFISFISFFLFFFVFFFFFWLWNWFIEDYKLANHNHGRIGTIIIFLSVSKN